MFILELFSDHSREDDKTAPMGTLGELYNEGVFQCYMIGQPWRDNRPFVSCVPVGTYDLIPHNSPHLGKCVAMVNHDLNVYETQAEAQAAGGGRYACLVHPANWSSQLQGCFAPGDGISWGTRPDSNGTKYKPNIMVTNSRHTLINLLPDLENSQLLIRWKH